MNLIIILAYGALTVAFQTLHPFTADLSPLLSEAAELYFPGSEGFANATSRWSAAIRPQFDVIVNVKTEEDVQHTVCPIPVVSSPRLQRKVRFANKHKRPFLTISGGHGQASTLGDVRKGVGIWIRGMNGVHVVDNGKAALIGGGIQSGELIKALWESGKQTGN
jgi:FAD/FMN-containing dehydrogenase